MDAKNTDAHATSAERLASAYLAALQAKDKEAILALLADDFSLIVPCNISGTNDLSDNWCGLEVASAKYEATFKKIKVLKYVDVVITPAKDESIAFAEGLGEMMTSGGRPYRNRYVFRFDVENGKIKTITEFANPVTAALSWGVALPQAEPIH